MTSILINDITFLITGWNSLLHYSNLQSNLSPFELPILSCHSATARGITTQISQLSQHAYIAPLTERILCVTFLVFSRAQRYYLPEYRALLSLSQPVRITSAAEGYMSQSICTPFILKTAILCKIPVRTILLKYPQPVLG